MLGPDGRPPPIRSGLRTPHVACKGCPPLEQLFEQFADGGGELVSCDAEEPCDRRAARGVVLVAMLERSRKGLSHDIEDEIWLARPTRDVMRRPPAHAARRRRETLPRAGSPDETICEPGRGQPGDEHFVTMMEACHSGRSQP